MSAWATGWREFGPYFTAAHITPWGQAVNLDQPGSDEVRGFLLGNALMWLRDYHLDGLRLDAVHALEDRRALHFLEELAAEVLALAALLNRELVLIAESDANDPRLVTSREAGGYGLAAQWSDDFHHAVHAAVTGERQGFYRDFGSLAALAKTLTKVFFHDGAWSSFRGRTHGRQVDVFRVPAHRFLGYLQNHDQIGNRATGDRISATVSSGLVKVGAGLVLTAPYTPMLFMGEEWGAGTPWQYFTDHTDPALASAVADGRRAEFAAHGWGTTDIPDPQDEATFLPLQAGLGRAGAGLPRQPARVVPGADRAAPGAAGTDRPPAGPGPGGLRRAGTVAGGPAGQAAGRGQPGPGQPAGAAGPSQRPRCWPPPAPGWRSART